MADVVKKTGLVPIKFKKKFKSWNIGEIAGFSPKKAQELVEAKAAEYYSAGKNKMQPASGK